MIGEADGVKSGINLINKTHPDIILLDIRMNDGTGFDLVDQLTECTPKIIFTTAYDEYALKAFKYKAVDYLLKPIDPESFKETINHLISLLEDFNTKTGLDKDIESKEIKKIAIPTQEGFRYIELYKILYLKADASYCTIFLNDNSSILVSKPLKYFADK